jgi:hypothetical protein
MNAAAFLEISNLSMLGILMTIVLNNLPLKFQRDASWKFEKSFLNLLPELSHKAYQREVDEQREKSSEEKKVKIIEINIVNDKNKTKRKCKN